VIDIRRFGGLRRRMPTTHWTFLVGCLALAGIFPLSGFWSKDAILAAVHERHGWWYAALYWTALATALLTAFYTFRAYFITFHGEEKIPEEAGNHAHESPDVMTGPLMLLAVFAIAVGGYFWATGGLESLLGHAPSLAYLGRQAEGVSAHGGSHLGVAIQSTVFAVLGVAMAAYLYLGARDPLDSLTGVMKRIGAYGLSYGKFFFDEMYDLLIVRPLAGFARLCAWFDRRVIDGLVDGIGRVPPAVGTVLRPLQSGMIQFYALAMVLGLLILIGTLLICGV
jgi:NADH-quinone oxidoreductase subunit L